MQILKANIDDFLPVLEAGGQVTLTVTGTSMLPLLRPGKDSVLLRSENNPKKGDILLYRRKNGRFVLHRVISKTQNALLCCGDNQWRKEPVEQAQVVAAVTGYCRSGKEKALSSFGYKFYVNLLPLRRLYCRLRDFLFQK